MQVSEPHMLPATAFYEADNVVLRFQHSRPEWAEAFLSEVEWGSGGLCFRVLDLRPMLEAFPDMGWVVLEKDHEPAGLYGLVVRERTWNGDRVPTVYRTLLAVHADRRRQSLGSILVRETRRFVREHLGRGVIFGFIEADNVPSMKLSRRAGYEACGQIITVTFSRTHPRRIAGVRRVRSDEGEVLRARLQSRYAGHGLADFELSLRPERCWGLERNGQLTAVLQAEPRRLELTKLGYGGLLKLALPWIPIVRTLVDPKDYRFLWFQHLLFDDERAEDCYLLMEGVLHEEGYRLANVQWDISSPVYRTWRRAGGLGPLAAFSYRFLLLADCVGVGWPTGPCVMTVGGV